MKAKYPETMPDPDIELEVSPIGPPEVPKPPTAPPVETNREKLYNRAFSCIGHDIARTQDELGCAEAVSYLLVNLHTPDFPAAGYLSTKDLYHWLQKYFTAESIPLPGDIIISPTGYGNGHIPNGHVGIVGKNHIMSNNSMTGLFDAYFTMQTWNKRYAQQGGYPVLFFRPKDII